MRLKFFLVSLSILLVTSFCIIFLLASFYMTERLAFIDDQLRETATAIVDSDLSDLKTYDYKIANAMISEELGPDRLGKFFIVRNSQNEILFQTDNIALLELSVPRTPRWVTIEQEDRLIRVLNLNLPNFPNRTLQVGAITDSYFVFWQTLNPRVVLLIGLILILVVIMTWFLSASLFSPVRQLESFLREAVKSMESGRDIPAVPSRITALKSPFFKRKDEFRRMVDGISLLVNRVNLNSKFTKSWTFQMIHEVKTPLTIMNREAEHLAEKYKWNEEELQSLLMQTLKISTIITNFLNWAEVAASDKPQNLHVIKAESSLQNVIKSLGRLKEDRLQVQVENDFEILCNPEHFEQLVENILTNSLKYSEGNILVRVKDKRLTIKDQGRGIPSEVLERIGTPFNQGVRGDLERGTGLGLAWVKTISDLYGWELQILSSSEGVEVAIQFPELEA